MHDHDHNHGSNVPAGHGHDHGHDHDHGHGHDHDHGHGHGEHHVHVIPFVPMFVTFIVLLALTALTVWAARLPMGATMHAVTAVFIAVVKATLVCAFFMHLKYDKPLNTIVLASSLIGIGLFIGLSALDLGTRGYNDPREKGEIYTGGRLTLQAGTLPPLEPGGDPRPKVDMNIVDFAAQHAAALHGNPDAHAAGEHAEEHADELHPAEEHADDQHGDMPSDDGRANESHADPATDPESTPAPVGSPR